MKVCKKCGHSSPDKNDFCEICGHSIETPEDDTNYYPEASGAMFEQSPLKFFLLYIVLPIVCFIISVIIVIFIKGSLDTSSQQTSVNKGVVQTIQKTTYAPGILSNEKYVSEHFGFQFETSENWTMFSEDALSSYSNNFRNTFISMGELILKSKYPYAHVSKWKNSAYAKTEMGAVYTVENKNSATVTVNVCSGFRDLILVEPVNISSKDLILQLKKTLSTTSKDISSGTAIIAGDSYDSVQFSLVENDVLTTNKIFITEQNGTFCIITCKASAATEKDLIDSCIKQFSKS